MRQASAQLSALAWHWLMHGMLPSQRRLQSVCAVWQRVLQDCTLAFADAHKVTKANTISSRVELTNQLNGRARPNFTPDWRLMVDG